MRRPRIAALGGGTGLASLLRGLKREPLDLTASVIERHFRITVVAARIEPVITKRIVKIVRLSTRCRHGAESTMDEGDATTDPETLGKHVRRLDERSAMLETDEARVGQQRARNAEFAGPRSEIHHGANPEFGQPLRGSFHYAVRRPVLLRHFAVVLRMKAI